MEIKCKKCKHEWKYKGESEYYIYCPKCRYNINLKKIRENDRG